MSSPRLRQGLPVARHKRVARQAARPPAARPAAAPRPLPPLRRVRHLQVEVVVAHARHVDARALRLVVVAVRDEGEALHGARLLVRGQEEALDAAKVAEQVAQLLLIRVLRQVGDAQGAHLGLGDGGLGAAHAGGPARAAPPGGGHVLAGACDELEERKWVVTRRANEWSKRRPEPTAETSPRHSSAAPPGP